MSALCIADDGVGGADTGDGMGLSNMRSRAENLREGRFELESAPGAGTAVKVSLGGTPSRLVAALDAGVADHCVRVAAGHASTASLGALGGESTLAIRCDLR